ncbi:MAG: FAD:protein FMN transferase [Candidatus Tectomicrobia bacterium]|nr:FAD:protein FMN transferase [Candidatus Tectomicrobia bacterium]
MLSRRRFLRSTLGALAGLLVLQRPAHTSALRRYRALPMLGTLVEVSISASPETAAPPPRQAVSPSEACFRTAFAAVRQVDHRMSVFQAASDVSRVNAAAGSGAVPIGADTALVLTTAGHIARQSGGALDVTLGRLSAWQRRSGAFVLPHRLIDAALAAGGMAALHLGAGGRLARLATPQAQLDLGAIAKGYAVDAALTALRRDRDVTAALVNAGGDLRAWGEPPGAAAWRIGVRHPLEPRRLLLVLLLEEGAVATSGNDLEGYGEGQARAASGLVLDPRSGAATPRDLTATVLAGSAMEADAHATAALVLGPEEGLPYLARVGAEGLFARGVERKSGPRLLVLCGERTRSRIVWLAEEAEIVS